MKTNCRVLVVATSRRTRGGITTVIKAHKTGTQWREYNCRWIETHIDSSTFVKLLYVIRGIGCFLLNLPKSDIVHFHVSYQGSLTRKYYLSKIARFFGRKVLVHFHPPGPNVLCGSVNIQKYKELFGTADNVLVLSSEWKRLLKEELCINQNVKVLHNPCPKVDKVFLDRDKANNRYILFAGTLIARKGYRSLIMAFSRIATDFPEWKLVLAGNGETKEAQSLIDSLGLQSQVLLKGWLMAPQIQDLYKNASIYCLSSSGEGFPMVVLEAWAYGVPVVTTMVGGLPDIVIEGRNALTFEFDNDKQLSKQLSRLMSDNSLRERLSSESLRLAEDLFNVDIINSQLGEIYRDLLV